MSSKNAETSAMPTISAEALRELRRKKNLSVADAARILGVTAATIEAWESGRRTIKKDIKTISSVRLPKQDCSSQSKQIHSAFSIKEVRNILGMSIDVMARRFGLSKSMLQSIEQDRRSASADFIRDIEQTFPLKKLVKLVELRQEIETLE